MGRNIICHSPIIYRTIKQIHKKDLYSAILQFDFVRGKNWRGNSTAPIKMHVFFNSLYCFIFLFLFIYLFFSFLFIYLFCFCFVFFFNLEKRERSVEECFMTNNWKLCLETPDWPPLHFINFLAADWSLSVFICVISTYVMALSVIFFWGGVFFFSFLGRVVVISGAFFFFFVLPCQIATIFFFLFTVLIDFSFYVFHFLLSNQCDTFLVYFDNIFVYLVILIRKKLC